MRLFTIGILKESREMNNDYKKAQFKKMVAEADLSLSCSDCPLIEEEALIWADKEMLALTMYNKQLIADLKSEYECIERLENALNQAVVAMRMALNAPFKVEAEWLALDLAKSVLNEKAGSNNW